MADKPPEHKITFDAIQLIISDAKSQWVRQALPLRISSREIINNDPAHVALIESVIGYLNGKGLLNTFVKIDHDEK